MKSFYLTFLVGGFLSLGALAVEAPKVKAKAVVVEETRPHVLIKTSMGEIELELFQDKTPITVKNFLSYVADGHYKDTIFHRVISNFMIQGGGMDQKMNEKKTKAPIENEADKGGANEKGTVAMARMPEPHSASAQFFINVETNSFLDHKDKSAGGWGYAVFGKVVKGMDVVNRIRLVKTQTVGMHQDVPVNPVMIQNIEKIEVKKN